jgi:hypothetical protein
VTEAALGAVGVGLAWVLAASQWWRARRDTSGVSAATWSLFLSVNLGWLAYAARVDAWHLAANASVAATFNVALLVRLPHRVRTVAAGVLAGVVFAVLGVASPALSVAAITVAALLLRWPQIVQLWRSDRATGVSLVAWGAGLANNVVWTALWFVRGDVAMSVSSVAITASTALLVALIVRRRQNAPFAGLVTSTERAAVLENRKRPE